MRRSIIALLAVVLIFAATSAYGQTGQVTFDANNLLDTLPDDLMGRAGAWEDELRGYATRLFWTLAVIEVVVAAIWLALSGGTLEAWFSELVRRILFIGFFAFVLTQGLGVPGLGAQGRGLAERIKDHFIGLSGAPSEGLRLSDIFDLGLRTAELMTRNMDWWNANSQGASTVIGICAILVVVSFAVLVAILLCVLLEATIGLTVGMVLLGFGGTTFTKDIAVRYLVFAVAIGLKVLVMYLIADLGTTLLFTTARAPGSTQTFLGPIAIVGLAIVTAIIAHVVPNALQKLVMGVSVPRSRPALEPPPAAPPASPTLHPVSPAQTMPGSGSVWTGSHPTVGVANNARSSAATYFHGHSTPVSSKLGLANSKLGASRGSGAQSTVS